VDRQEAERLGKRTGRSVSFLVAADTPGTDSLIERRLETGAGSPAAARELRAIRLRRWALASGEWPEQQDAPHDWAETALEEGELLALRLPKEGGRLLNLAARLFEQAGDLHGTTIATIRSVIAYYHDGKSDGAGYRLNQVKPRYDRLRALVGPDMPAWDSLVDWGRARPGDATSGGAWDGWLIRLAVCLARRSGQRLEPPVPAAELNLTPAPRYRGPVTRVWRVVKAVGLTAWGLWTVFIVIVGGASLGRTGLGTLGWHPPPFVGWAVGLVGAILVFIAGVALLVALISPVLKLIGAQFRLVADVEPVVSEDGPPHRAYVWVRVQPKRRGLGLLAAYFGGYIGHTSELWSFLRRKFTGSGTPRPLGAELPLRPDPLRTPAPLQLTRALGRALNVHIDELVLRVGPKVAPGAWEAALNVTLITGSDKGIARDFRSFRAYEARASHPAPTRLGAVAVLCARPFALLAEASWEADGVTPQLFYGEDLRDFERVPHVDVLHLIGTPVPDELGPMLALEGSAAHTLQPDRLPLSDARVIIVQAEPIRSSVSADPRTELLRAIAYDIAAASAGAAVIALPALPSHLAAKLTEEIARTIADGQPSRRDLLDLIHRLREMVFLGGDPEDAVTTRALVAFDVCLYLGGMTSGQSARS
jgi:hypothetical protein